MSERRKPPRFEVITRADGRVYLRRWRLWRGRFFSVCLHRFMAPDQSACAHDHPWPFVSLVLWAATSRMSGRTATPPRRSVCGGGSCRWRLAKRCTATGWWRAARAGRGRLVLTGPRCRSWGFRTRAGGWVPEESFDRAADC